MKTTKNTFLKVLGMVALTLTLVSCGKDNNSGGGSVGAWNSNINGLGITGNQVVSQVSQTNPCIEGTTRDTTTYQLQGNGQIQFAIGVTSMGDIAVLSSTSSYNATLTVYSCRSVTGQQAQPAFSGSIQVSMTQCGYYGLTMGVSYPTRGYYNGAFRPALISCSGTNYNNGYNNGYNYGW